MSTFLRRTPKFGIRDLGGVLLAGPVENTLVVGMAAGVVLGQMTTCPKGLPESSKTVGARKTATRTAGVWDLVPSAVFSAVDNYGVLAKTGILNAVMVRENFPVGRGRAPSYSLY